MYVSKLVTTFSTHFLFVRLVSEKEIKELEQSYCQLYTSNNNHRQQQQITAQIFSHVLTPVLPAVLIPGIFQAFDENRDGKDLYGNINDSILFAFAESIDFKELVCGISAACRGPQFQRYKCKFIGRSIFVIDLS